MGVGGVTEFGTAETARHNHISRSEWSFAVLIAVLLTAFLQVPYALGYALARPGTEFTGLLINVEDASYLSGIGQGIEGAWQYRLLFTTEDHSPAFIEVFYLVLGHLARGLNLSAVAMWHAARIVADFVLVLVTFGFIAHWIDSPQQRRVALLLAVLSAGLDLWRFPFDPANLFEAIPIDLHIPEAHLFYSALTYPHFAVGISLVLITFWLLLQTMLAREPSPRRWMFALGAALGNILIGIVYPFLIFLMATVIGAFALFLVWREKRILWREGAMLFIAFAIPAPLFLYYQIELATNPVLRAWNEQAVTLSPNPIHYLLAYAPLLPFAVLAWFSVRRIDEDRKRRMIFLWIWVCAVSLLLYTPVTQQRRFVEGVQVPLAILAAVGLFDVVLPRLRQSRVFATISQRPGYSGEGLQQLLLVGLILLASLTSLSVWLSSVALLAVEQPYPLFRPIEEMQAMDWLRNHSAHTESIFSSYWTGSFLPSRSAYPVFVGHRYETIHFDEKRRESEQFFDAATADAWREQLLRENRIAFVFWGRGERDLGSFAPERAAYLRPVFANDMVRIYRVVPQ